VDPRSVLGSGDVKYHGRRHGGISNAARTKTGLHLASNPSHLEAVDPVAIGRARAKQARIGQRGAQKSCRLCCTETPRLPAKESGRKQ